MSLPPIEFENFAIGKGMPLCLIAGPCAIESKEHAMLMACRLKQICQQVGVQFIFKASFDKANRSHHTSYRGPGLVRGLEILQAVKETYAIPVTSDIHLPDQAAPVGEVCDLIQIPALLSRQTDLLQAAARTGRPVNVKKGQFTAPWDMSAAVEKIRATGNQKILLTERGSSFGYNYLINDFRALPIMRELASGVCFDATHSVQLPGMGGMISGGQPEYLLPLTRAAVAAGCDALFIEVHDAPALAKSDSATVCPLDRLCDLLRHCRTLHELNANISP